MNYIIAIYGFFLIILLLYSLTYVFSAISFLFIKKANQSSAPDKIDIGKVAVIIPSYNEGSELIDCIKTVIKQDYLGKVSLYILFKDNKDSSYKDLKNFISKHKDPNRDIFIKTLGFNNKREKINLILPELKEDYIAFLDADHRASSSWISNSLNYLKNNKVCAVQSKRSPLALSNFFQVWDSMQNHIGNEVFNYIYKSLGFTTFFTGTTAVFKAKVLKDKLLPQSLTEDTSLSYDLILQGKKIAYNPIPGSFEDVSPNLSTYISRRRRWSNGHTKTFLSNLKNIINTKPFSLKIQLLLHGAFYLLPILILVCSQIVGWYFFFQYTASVKILALIISFFIAIAFTFYRYTNFRNFLLESLVSFLCIFPYISSFSILFYYFFQQEQYYNVISFPYHSYLYWIITYMMLAPVSVLIVGKRLSPYPKAFTFFSFLITYPLIFLIDILACSLGFFDLILKQRNWGVSQRSNFIQENIVPDNIYQDADQNRVISKKVYFITTIPIFIILLILTNDFLIFHNCGMPKYLLDDYVIFKTSPPITSSFNYTLKSSTKGKYEGELKHFIKNNNNINGTSVIMVDNKELYSGPIQKSLTQYKFSGPMGFDTKTIDIRITTPNFSCVQKKSFATSVKEIKNNKLYLNGEPFLIKCIIPSFSLAQNNISIEMGLKQIKEVGANCIRLYHTPSKEIMEEASKQNLMIISQPDETTWENIKIHRNYNIKILMKRYREHHKLTQGYPYILLDHLGNELELNNNFKTSINNIHKTAELINSKDFYRFPLSYSTYLTYLKYPVDILGINMLDSGYTYWEDALDYLKSLNSPFYASELGGFVAYYERTPTFVRINRMNLYWKRLLQLGASGAAFFQSHDNWAQPVPFGFNDPFKNELPDDNRGLWDKENNEKPELNALKAIFNDFKFKPLNNNKIEITNTRDFTLNDIKILFNEKSFEIDKLNPKESRTIKIPLKDLNTINIQFKTHQGLTQELNLSLNQDLILQKNVLKKTKLKTLSIKKADNQIELVVQLPTHVDSNDYLLLEGLGSNLVTFTNPKDQTQTQWETHNYREQIMPIQSILNKIGKTKKLKISFKRNLLNYLNEEDGKEIKIELQDVFLIKDLL